eukprot:NODE_648_length_5041_cov_0.519021.p2 type:complete len:291 gc:universal NODE_648_length_5041_cov_0.519021:3929-4801(+)
MEWPVNWKEREKHRVLRFFHHTIYELEHPMVSVRWNSRDHRKGKLQPISELEAYEIHKSFDLVQIDNISWYVALLFSIGSIWWVINGIYSFHLANMANSLEIANIFGLLGGLTFLLGGYTMYLEGLNVNKRPVLMHHLMLMKLPIESRHEKWRWVGNGDMHELGYAASVLQFIGTIVFGIGPIVGILQVENEIILYLLYWLPQVIGALFLILSSFCIMFEVQDTWWHIKLTSLGWYIGFFNILGSVGFFISGFIGFFTMDGVALTSYLGSWFFLIGSLLQFFEIIYKVKH